MLDLSSPDDPQDERGASTATQPAVCEICQDPGKPVKVEGRDVVVLCEACLGSQLRRRLPWRRYLGLLWTSLLLIPSLTLLAGVTAEAVEALRFRSVPPTSTLFETLQHGWELLTAGTDPWGSLGVFTAIAIALPISLVTIASHGEQIARRAETAPVPSLDDYTRLTLLDSALTLSKAIALLTAVLTSVLGIDALLDGRTGWAQQTLTCLILVAVLLIEIGKLDAFPKFADRSRLLVKTALTSGVAGRRDQARQAGLAKATRALVIALALHVLGYLTVALPAGPAALANSLTVTIIGIVCMAMLAGLAALYLSAGDRPTVVLTVLVGLFIGAFWVSILYSVADEMRTRLADPWVAAVGAWSFGPLYLLIALGLLGTGPLRWLAYYTVRIDDALTTLDNAARDWTRRRDGLDRTMREGHETPSLTARSPDRQEQPTAGAPGANAPQAAHHKHNAVGEALDNASGDAPDSSLPVAERTHELPPSPGPSTGQLPGS